MSLQLTHEELASRIDQSRLRYSNDTDGPAVSGQTVIIEFAESVAPERFCSTVSTTDEPWCLFGLSRPLSADDYYKLLANLFHIENGDVVEVSDITVEVAPDWARLYVREGADEHRVAEFVEAVDDQYGLQTTSLTADDEDA